MPPHYPYPNPLPSGAYLPPEDLAVWSSHWIPVSRPEFADIVNFEEDHVGILLGDMTAPEVLHCHRTHGTTLHPLSRLTKYVSGIYRLESRVHD